MNTTSLSAKKLILCNLLAIASFAGNQALALDLKPACAAQKPCDSEVFDWKGFYVGLHAGGQFGNSENTDLDGWNSGSGIW
ncbi:MAG: hypothetical protein NTZ16_07625, partial [Verrucomicrobia bacterium]|nr:hypothetical protein [Verrucomicrobiota bacterium]